MSWTKEDQAKLREYQTAQMTVKEIAKKMGKPSEWIRSELENMGYKPIEEKEKPEKSEFLNGTVKISKKPYARITTGIEKKCLEMRDEGLSILQISKRLNIGCSSISRIFKKYNKKKPSQINEDFEAAVNEMIEEIKEEKEVKLTDTEKEPAPVATVTDSSREKEVSLTNDNTNAPKCQSLTGVKMVGILEDLLHELYDETVEITSLGADTEHCDIRFTQGGREYGINFGLVGGMPRYEEVRK